MTKNGPPAPPKGAVLKKRKKALGISCDRDCDTCRTPCDHPLKPIKNKGAPK